MATDRPSIRIDEFYAILGKNSEGVEGIASAINPRTRIMEPLIGGEARLPTILTLAMAGAKESGMTFELVRFRFRESIRFIKPTDLVEEEDGEQKG